MNLNVKQPFDILSEIWYPCTAMMVIVVVAVFLCIKRKGFCKVLIILCMDVINCHNAFPSSQYPVYMRMKLLPRTIKLRKSKHNFTLLFDI